MMEPHQIRSVMLVLQSTAVGGMETHCVDLAAEYVRRGIEVTAVVPEAATFDTLAARFGVAGTVVRRIETDARQGRARQLARLASFGRALRSRRPDVVHVHTGGATGGLAPMALARMLSRATVVLTEHDVPTEHASRRQLIVRRLMDRIGHALVAVSRRNARLRRERAGAVERKFAVVLNGVPVPDTLPDMSAERPDVRSELGVERDAVLFGSVVRLAEGKGLHELLRAAELAMRTRPCDLLLVGDGPLRGELEDLATQLGIRDRVHFVGHQQDPQRFMAAMDVFVLAVPAGSMSIALLEAMAAGLPPVITFGGPEEAVIDGETGIAAPPNDPSSLAEALLRLGGDATLRKRLGRAAHEHVRSHFSVARVADDLLDVYAGARRGSVPEGLRADGPPNPRPGSRPVQCIPAAAALQATIRTEV